jgi:hypothetical protein
MDGLEQTIHDAALLIVRRSRPDVASLAAHHRLVDHLGFGSLDVAELVARLELSLGVDPFAEHVAISGVRTMADLYAAYRRCTGGAGRG